MMATQTLVNTAGNTSQAAPFVSSTGTKNKIHLILVDDDEDYREITAVELADYGFDVITFGDGPPLIHYFAGGNSADAVVLDWNLPSVMGIDLVPRLRCQGITI